MELVAAEAMADAVAVTLPVMPMAIPVEDPIFIAIFAPVLYTDGKCERVEEMGGNLS